MGIRNWRNKRKKILHLFDYECLFCKEQLNIETLSIDHILSVGKSGTDDVGNLVASCAFCNQKKNDNDFHIYVSTLSNAKLILAKVKYVSIIIKNVKLRQLPKTHAMPQVQSLFKKAFTT